METSPIDRDSVIIGPTIPRSDQNSAPGSCQAIVPSVHPTRSVRLLVYTARPPAGGDFRYVYLCLSTKILAVYDLRSAGIDSDVWGGFPFVSGDTNTVKICVNARGSGDGSGRRPIFFDTGLRALPTL